MNNKNSQDSLLVHLFATKENALKIIVLIISVFLAILAMAFSAEEFFNRLSRELIEYVNVDSGLYYTVGKGMASGLIPYADLYENKPPLIFLMSELSYLLTGDFYLMNVFSFLGFLTIFLVPIALTAVICVKEHKDIVTVFILTSLSIPFSVAFSCYCEKNAAFVQVETFGVACLLLSFFCMSLSLGHEVKFYSPSIILSGFFLGLAAMLKEPFAVLGVYAFLYFLKSRKDWISRFLVPTLYGGLVAVIILLATRSFVPYFTIYLRNMFSNHITEYGSPWERGIHLFKLFDHLRVYSLSLEVLTSFAIGFDGLLSGLNKYSDDLKKDLLWRGLHVFKVLGFLLLSSFMVGLGGQYFNHHYLFAVPFYLLTFADLIHQILTFDYSQLRVFCRSEKGKKKEFKLAPITASATCAVIFSSCLIGLYSSLKPVKVDRSLSLVVEQDKAYAKYIDDILDAYGASTYLYMGFNRYGEIICEYTSHLPSGPCFVQDPDNFETEDSFFAKSFMDQLYSVDILVDYYLSVGVLKMQTRVYMSQNFTLSVPISVFSANIEEPSGFPYKIYYRTSSTVLP